MKAILTSIFCALSVILNAQPFSDIIPENPGKFHSYYENIGQLLDNGGNSANDILYYTLNSEPQVFVKEHSISLSTISLDTIDSLHLRLDINFVCTFDEEDQPISCTESVTPSEQTPEYINFFYPHCPDGITNVDGYSRIVYENAFPLIDIHLYSNELGFKTFFVIKPGGNPADISMLFQGQDSIEVDSLGILSVYFGAGNSFHFPQATAYEIDGGGNPLSLTWLPEWNDVGSGYVDITTFSYNPSNTLVLRLGASMSSLAACSDNLNWSTYFGGTGQQEVIDVENATGSSDFYVLTRTSSASFPQQAGIQGYNGSSDVHLTKFDSSRNVSWMTFFGSPNQEDPADMEYYETDDLIFVCGSWYKNGSTSTVLPFPASNSTSDYTQTTPGGFSDMFIVSFNSLGATDWVTLLGGNDADIPTSMAIMEDFGILGIAGFTQSDSTSIGCDEPTNVGIPICGDAPPYHQTQFGGGQNDGYLASFVIQSADKNRLNYSTYFGGEGFDEIYDIQMPFLTQNKLDIFISGWTSTTKIANSISSPTAAFFDGTFPLANPSGSHFQSNGAGGFISHFQAYTLLWSSRYSGSALDEVNSIEFDDANNLVIAGHSTSQGISGCTTVNGTNLPLCNNNGISFINNNDSSLHRDDFILAKFNTSYQLLWSSYMGSDYSYDYSSDLTSDDEGNIFFLGTSESSTSNSMWVQPAYNTYYKSSNSGNNDLVLAMFNSDNQLHWSTYIGNTANDGARAIEYGENSLKVAGRSSSTTNSPYLLCNLSGSYYLPTNNNPYSGIITEFIVDSYFRTGIKKNSVYEVNSILFPNPCSSTIYISLNSEFQYSSYIIFDLQGKKVKSSDIYKGMGFSSIDVSKLKSGIYLLVLNYVDQNKNNGIIKEKFIKID